MKKRKRVATQTTRDNPEWTEATFRRARPAKDVLPALVGATAAKALLRPRRQPPT